MNKLWNIILFLGFLVPLVLLLWPFAQWGTAMELILRVVPALSAQVLLCRTGKHRMLMAVPLLLTGLFAFWGTYLYFTSPHWVYATFWGSLIADYVSPFISCAAVYTIYKLLKFRYKVS